MRYYERTKPFTKQVKGLDHTQAILDAYDHTRVENNTNPFAKTLLSVERKATKKPKIDETTMFEGLGKQKKKVKKSKAKYKLNNGVRD